MRETSLAEMEVIYDEIKRQEKSSS
jgi:hypothetical protein